MRNAPPGAAVEVNVSGAVTGTGTVGEDGNASVPFTLGAGKAEMDANVFVDICDKMRRVIVVERGRLPPPPGEGCDRRDISGVFWVRPVNTLVVDFGGASPSMLLVKGSYTPPKPQAEGEEESSGPRHQAPTGFVLFGGGGLTKFRDATNIACGNVTNCAGSSGVGYSFGAAYWFTRFLGAEVTYLNPKTLSIDGRDSTFAFNTKVNSNLTTVAGLLALPAGPMRFYGKGGWNYQQTTQDTTETIGTATQTFQLKTSGWNWIYGGGAEAWFTSKFGIYGEIGYAKVAGDAEVGTIGRFDDRLSYLLFGARLRIGG